MNKWPDTIKLLCITMVSLFLTAALLSFGRIASDITMHMTKEDAERAMFFGVFFALFTISSYMFRSTR